MADKAVLCGINNYQTITDLRGCINDVKNVFDLLTQVYNFDPAQIHQLTDGEVTKAAIKREYDWLLNEAQAGDRLVFHFSGHGSYVPDDNGDEPDSVDEITCLYDMDFYNPATFMRDDEWQAMIRQIPQDVNLTFILDNCHSGTGTRAISIDFLGYHQSLAVDVAASERRSSNSKVKALASINVRDNSASVSTHTRDLKQLDKQDYRNLVADRDVILSRFINPPAEFKEKIIATALTRGLQHRDNRLEKHLLLAGCRDNQTAADAYINGDFHGAFTYYLCQTLRESPNLGSDATIDRVANFLSQNQFQQVPQHEGIHRYSSIFGDRAFNSNFVTKKTSDLDRISLINSGNLTAENQKLLIEAYMKLLDTLSSSSEPKATVARQVGERYLIYVHGISQHLSGYSNRWWNALKGFVGHFGNGNLGDTRREVLWSDLVNTRTLAHQIQQQQLSREIELILEERRTQMIAANIGGGHSALRATLQSSIERGGFAIDDFLIYMLDDNVRQQIIDRFTGVVRPLLENGAHIDIISHSWGTVVAYEGLRELEKLSLPGVVSAFFTVGSALSISPVRDRLRKDNKDGNRPTNVKQWLNLDAKGDLVGGMLGNKFDVTQEYLNLTPTGCSRSWGFYNLGCAHSSYFDRDNTAVNRHIFAKYINN